MSMRYDSGMIPVNKLVFGKSFQEDHCTWLQPVTLINQRSFKLDYE